MAIGRISGPLLKANLLRENVNLAFENDLLYLDVNNSRIGINNDTPQYDLDVVGTTRAPQLEIATRADIADVSIVGNQIFSNTSTLSLGTANNVVYQNKLVIDDFDVENNVISTNNNNKNINLSPNGTGSVEVFADTNVYGNITASGTVTAEGNITLGDADTDNVTFNAEIASNIIPDVTGVYSLGSDPASGGKQWADVHTDNFFAGTVTTTALEVDGVDLALRQGNILYVAENGDDTYSGDHPNDPYRSLTYALTQATAGDTIHIYPGVYEETFPMTVPAGVTVKGHSIRSVKIVPTTATQSNDAFMLNGETTVEDITIADFYYDSINDDGYAFKFAPGCNVQTRSPYVRNISVITQGSITSSEDPRGFDQGDAGKGALIDGSAVDAASREAAMLFHSVTFITPGVDALTITNGARVEWLNCFTYFADKGLYALDGATGLKGTGQTAVRVDGLDGSFVAGETFEYYDTDGVTLLASGTIDSVDADDKFYITGNLTGLEEAGERGGKSITSYGNAALETDQAKFGASSLFLDGVDDYLSIAANNDFGFGTDDFTIETWVYPTSSQVSRIFDFRAGAIVDNAVSINLNGLTPQVYIDGAYQITGSSDLTINTWNHLAYVRNGTTGTLYVDGTSVGSWTDNTDYGVAKPLIIGALYTGALSFFEGYIDEVRISKGLARYNANFGVPLAEFTSDTNTVLLLHFNGDDSSNVIEDDALNSQDLRFSGGATAGYISLVDRTDFGGELRSIASASIYGNYGAYGDGNGVLMYLISQNFAYIGNGKEVDNDPNTVIQANEVVELNNAKIRYSSVDHRGDFRVGEFFYVNQADGTVDFTSSEFNIDTTSGLTINTAGSTTTITGDRIDTGNLRISGNTIESLSGDLDLDADSGIIRINSTGSLQLPSGNTASRPTPELGMIRYNTDTNLFEGYDGNWIALNGIYDLDLDTYITAEATPGANDDTLRFYVGGSQVVDIDENRLNTPKIVVDDITIDGNVIETTTTNTDLVLSANGTGEVVIDELSFKDSSITNRTPDGILYFQQSGSGYFKIEGTGGFVVPVGSNGERPEEAYRETGMTRYNTEQRYLEIWDGFSWVSVAGATGSISVNAAEDLAIEYVLTLG